jgi:long-subunit acyl-CoA synthetase (AMP-forming)
MRPYWKGYLKLALVSCPIALHAACSSAERIAFRQINKATGNRLRQQLTSGSRLSIPRENLEWCGISLHTNLMRKEPSSWFVRGSP